MASASHPRANITHKSFQPSFRKELDIGVLEHGWYGSMINCLGECAGAFGSIPCCVCCPNPYEQVDQGNVGMVTRFGKFYKCVDPGLVRINPFSEHVAPVDIKIQIVDLPEQVIMTKDNVNIIIDSVLYYHIVDPYQAHFGVRGIRKALEERTQTTLRQVLGNKVLQDCIEKREDITREIEKVTAPIAKSWGVKIESILIKDLRFSKSLQESLSAAAQAKRVGESKIIAAKAEVDSAKLMREAADILNTPAAMQIRYLDTVAGLAKSSNTRVVFLPPEPSSTDGHGAGGSNQFGARQIATWSALNQS